MQVFLDRQHRGKPGRWNDEGAKNAEMTETYLTSQYIFHAENHLIMHGIDVIVLTDGHYSERHARVNEYVDTGLSVYIACHINAGGGDYGASFYDYRSTAGSKLAHLIDLSLANLCPELRTVKRIECRPDDWTKNAYYTIKGVARPVAICFEPLFIDCKDHEPLTTPEGIRRVGVALAEGITNYLKSM
jgi:N-acetylmuramoyl-L-alanine amidase